MRERTVNEKAVVKTLAFLNHIYNSSNSAHQKPLSLLYAEHHISKSTGSVCVRLGLINVDGGRYVWRGETYPTRENVITILEELRRRNDKQVLVPLAGFETLVDNLGALVETLSNKQPNTHGETKMLHRALNQATPTNQTLFSETDKKRDDLIKIASAIAEGMHSNTHRGDIIDYQKPYWINDQIIIISQDLLTKIYNSK